MVRNYGAGNNRQGIWTIGMRRLICEMDHLREFPKCRDLISLGRTLKLRPSASRHPTNWTRDFWVGCLKLNWEHLILVLYPCCPYFEASNCQSSLSYYSVLLTISGSSKTSEYSLGPDLPHSHSDTCGLHISWDIPQFALFLVYQCHPWRGSRNVQILTARYWETFILLCMQFRWDC